MNCWKIRVERLINKRVDETINCEKNTSSHKRRFVMYGLCGFNSTHCMHNSNHAHVDSVELKIAKINYEWIQMVRWYALQSHTHTHSRSFSHSLEIAFAADWCATVYMSNRQTPISTYKKVQKIHCIYFWLCRIKEFFLNDSMKNSFESREREFGQTERKRNCRFCQVVFSFHSNEMNFHFGKLKFCNVFFCLLSNTLSQTDT